MIARNAGDIDQVRMRSSRAITSRDSCGIGSPSGFALRVLAAPVPLMAATRCGA
ncbi:hypothetical protein GCM10022240_06560 [Microbacterium kribbense]|uniref:Uncharacterized protein n=1 Tax=Microbacterium kribbense TaxID=433645 RepID=A0ABP7G4Y7_9MICO